MPFWERVETWLLDLRRDGERAARYARIAYWISLGFVLFGFLVAIFIVAREAGR